MPITTGDFQDLVQLSQDTLYFVGPDFQLGNTSVGSSASIGFNKLTNTDPRGVIHFSGDELMNRVEFAERLAQAGGRGHDVDWHLRADGTVDGRSPDLGDVRGGLLRFAVQRYSGPFLGDLTACRPVVPRPELVLLSLKSMLL